MANERENQRAGLVDSERVLGCRLVLNWLFQVSLGIELVVSSLSLFFPIRIKPG